MDSKKEYKMFKLFKSKEQRYLEDWDQAIEFDTRFDDYNQIMSSPGLDKVLKKYLLEIVFDNCSSEERIMLLKHTMREIQH